MKKIKFLLPFIFILFLLNSCIVFKRIYKEPSTVNYESSTDRGPILTFIYLNFGQSFKFPSSYFQSVFPLPYENYKIWFSVSNINNVLKDVREDYIEDIMLSMYFDKFRIVLPSGKIIDLTKKRCLSPKRDQEE